MAFIHCNKCNKMYSDKIDICPFCKHPMDQPLQPFENISKIKQKLSSFFSELKYKTGYLSKYIIPISFLFIVSIGAYFILYSYLSPYIKYNSLQRHIIERQIKYKKAIHAMDYDLSYSFLSSYSKSNIPRERWGKYVFSTAQKLTQEVKDVVVDSGNIMARLDVKSIVRENGSTILGSQKWINESGEWYRAFAEDNENTKLKEAPKSENLLIWHSASSKASFELVDLEKSWYESQSSLQKETLFEPQLKFRVKNTGNQDIKYLKILVEYYKSGTKELFDKTEGYIISSGDRPLQPGYSSETKFLRSSIGFVINQKDYFQKFDIITKYKLDIKIFYKMNYSEEWTIFKELNNI